jgi:adenylate kinase
MSAPDTPQKKPAAQMKNERDGWFQAAADCSRICQTNGAPWRLVLLGAPGVGKGTQAYLLNQRLKACHLSTGDLFRAAAKKNECDLTPAMKSAMERMRRGELVPDATVWEMVRERADCIRCADGFVLDGFPRTLGQAESLKQLMEGEKISLTAVVNYELPVEEITFRLSGRRTCRTCKSVFHVANQPPKSENICDHCGGPLYQRDDDRPESISVRLQAYQRSTAPLIHFYKQLGVLLSIPATGSPDEICSRTLAALHPRTRFTASA